jgi:flagellar basal body-associated protein FliL
MSQRPSLLDDSDFSAIGTGKKGRGGGGGGGGADKSKMIKIGVLVGVFALAALVYAWPYIRPEKPPTGKDGKPIIHQETEEDRQEFQRQQERMQLEVEQGRAVIGGA